MFVKAKKNFFCCLFSFFCRKSEFGVSIQFPFPRKSSFGAQAPGLPLSTGRDISPAASGAVALDSRVSRRALGELAPGAPTSSGGQPGGRGALAGQHRTRSSWAAPRLLWGHRASGPGSVPPHGPRPRVPWQLEGKPKSLSTSSGMMGTRWLRVGFCILSQPFIFFCCCRFKREGEFKNPNRFLKDVSVLKWRIYLKLFQIRDH